MKNESRQDELLNEEIEKRLSIMESEEYEFPERFGRNNYIVLVVVIVICLAAVIAGAWI